MDKVRRRPAMRDKRERIGVPTGLLNRDGNEIVTGDYIRMHGRNTYEGIVLWNRAEKCYGIFLGMWYGDRNEYDADCYGKFLEIPKDNGMRMELEPINEVK